MNSPWGNPGRLFWLITLGLVAYVALCTPFRDNVLEADAWEHHRAVVALTHDLWHPGNPTFATDEPSIRYSPYTVSLAVISRATGIDPWHVLSAAAALNTLLLCLAVRALLGALGRADASALALIVMVSLYGGAPGYANSYALADLPWHQVNPSAFAFPVILFSWAIFVRFVAPLRPEPARGGSFALWLILTLMLAAAILDHAMTGALGFLGLGVFAVAVPGTRPAKLHRLVFVGASAVGAALLCVAWPWYSFSTALLHSPNKAYWYNPAIVRLMLTQWCAPALVLSLWAMTARDFATVRVLLIGGFACLCMGLGAIFVHSPTLARLPLPGLIFFHLAIAITAQDSAFLSPSAWAARIRGLHGPRDIATPAAFATAAAIVMFYFLAPQLAAIPREPHLARAYVAPLLHRENKQPDWRRLYAKALVPVHTGDVVLSDPRTSWPVPSFGGRIVAADHYEFFTLDQPQRDRDAEGFFTVATDRERLPILDRYNVRWILVNSSSLTDAQRTALVRETAIAARSGDLVLMDAVAWKTHILASP